ncbi:MAG TPA: tRNA-dihydrouridine synthase, partial [Pseudorhizobium sp.]|nr:tRNA-dihydrouridine synthase [Pseudorhizobium sp.]
WDENSINAPQIARQAEQAGICLVTIHGRTRMQFYEGKADWDAIRQVRDVISVPLIANGDVKSEADALEILRRSGADAVMVGRGAQGRPWHPGKIAGHNGPSWQVQQEIVAEHYEAMLDFYGREVGLRHARKHLGWYLEELAPATAAEEKAAIFRSTDPTDVMRRMAAALQVSEGPVARKAA